MQTQECPNGCTRPYDDNWIAIRLFTLFRLRGRLGTESLIGVTGKVSGVWGEWGMTPVGRPWDAHRTPHLHTHLVPPVLEKSRPHSKFTAPLRCKTPVKLSQLVLQGLTVPFARA